MNATTKTAIFQWKLAVGCVHLDMDQWLTTSIDNVTENQFFTVKQIAFVIHCECIWIPFKYNELIRQCKVSSFAIILGNFKLTIYIERTHEYGLGMSIGWSLPRY